VPEQFRKKLIEVALPLEAINAESAREKSIRHGHPSTLHLWWARRPLAACRAVLFASLVDDPSSRPADFPTEEAQEAERQRLFRIIEELVKWENSNNETVLEAARAEILKSTDGDPPAVLDPFCGGGSIPLEAQRLGLEAHASDLNPVAVLITKALIEIPPRFEANAPVNPESRNQLGHGGAWKRGQGLAEDVRYYGRWMRDEGFRQLGHLYPEVSLGDGTTAPVLAWIWARTITCTNPACAAELPLVRSFALGTKKGKEVSVLPVIDRDQRTIQFEIVHRPAEHRGNVKRTGATCLVCDSQVPLEHVRAEGRAGRLGTRLMAVAADAGSGRAYLPPTVELERLASSVADASVPETELPDEALGFRVQGYGLRRHRDLYTRRQLATLSALVELVGSVKDLVREHALEAGLVDGTGLEDGGSDATAYAEAVSTYLALAVSRLADYSCTISVWASNPQMEIVVHAFGRQALPMTWDFAEANIFGSSSGSLEILVGWIAKVLERLPASGTAVAKQLDAVASLDGVARPLILTDPPYYDNIGYADLSDFFYFWLRQALHEIYPSLFATLVTPKDQELIADPSRFGGDRGAAHRHFEQGLDRTFERIHDAQAPFYPFSFFYAFKQLESDEGATTSSGWESMLEGLIHANYVIVGTWPIRTEKPGRLRETRSNALASSIVLACRPRLTAAPVTTRRDFVSGLRTELPAALRTLEHANIPPVDLAQAAIGPGMAIFSRYAKVVEADGSTMTVRTALGLINNALDEILAQQEGDFDPYTRFAVSWFKEYGFGEGEYGRAETLATARAVSVDGVVRTGILHSRGSRVRLLKRGELDPLWDPASDQRPTVWEATHHLVRRLDEGGESSAAELLRRLGGYGETARELAHVLYSVCDRKGWAQEALDYNALGTAWHDIAQLAAEQGGASEQQALGV
jgi:putative DNA methylase